MLFLATSEAERRTPGLERRLVSVAPPVVQGARAIATYRRIEITEIVLAGPIESRRASKSFNEVMSVCDRHKDLMSSEVQPGRAIFIGPNVQFVKFVEFAKFGPARDPWTHAVVGQKHPGRPCLSDARL